MQLTYEVKDAGGLRQMIIRTQVQNLFVGAEAQSEGGTPDVRRTTVDQAVVVVMDHAVLSDEGEVFRTNGTAATAGQIIQAVQNGVFVPAWQRVSESDVQCTAGHTAGWQEQ